MCDAVFDPAFDVAPLEAYMSADPEAGRALAAVSPRVDGGDGNVEIVGEVLGGDQRFEMLHAPIMRLDPVSPRSFDAQPVIISGSDTVPSERSDSRR